jgi:hypothetical protein
MSSSGSSAKKIEASCAARLFGWPERHSLVIGAVLIIITLAIYAPVRHYPFFDVDDDAYVAENAHVLAPLTLTNVEWGFTHRFCLNYDPVTF